mgnify:CR=1 FL=1
MISKPLENFVYPTNPQNLFGAVRKHDIHTGIDLFCPENEIVHAISDCIVSKIGYFTGTKSIPETPWWNDTEYVICKTIWENKTLYFLYGELLSSVSVGDILMAGSPLGSIKRVIKNDKGLPTTMLHFEIYKSLPENPVFWYHNEEQPDILINPETIINKALNR